MAESVSTAEVPDDEFDVETNNANDIATTLERLKEFSFYLVENVEVQLNFFLGLLEEKDVLDKPNSLYATAISKLLSAVPKLGSALGSGVAKGEIVVLGKIDKKNSRTLADLVYHFSDHKEEFRQVLIESSIDIFYSFEHQFLKLTCNGGPKRAMQKLARDASDRIFNYLLETEQQKNITRTEIANGVLLGDSKRNRTGMKEGKTVMRDETKWKTCKLYRKTGIVIVEEKAFFKNAKCKTEKYGHRRLFPWEKPEDIKQTWERDSDFEVPCYTLVTREDISKIVKDYIMTKDPFEEAKLERENYSKEALEDRRVKHEEALKMFQEHFKEFLDELQRQYEIIVASHRESQNLLIEISNNQGNDKALHQELDNKLDEIRKDVKDTKMLVERNEIGASNSSTEKVNVPDVATEIRRQVVDITKEALRKNDPGPKIGRELRRFFRKL